MSLTFAPPAIETPMETIIPTIISVISTATAAPTAAAAPVGDNNNTNAVPASATVMIVIGVVLGIVGVASVITLIWWMRRRHLARLSRTNSYPTQNLYPPMPSPKAAGGSNKALPNINVASANAYGSAAPQGYPHKERSNTVGSIDKDKALPIKPVDSVWSPSDRPNKSPALASMHEMRSHQQPTPPPKRPHDEEMAMGRARSHSIDQEPTAPANFI